MSSPLHARLLVCARCEKDLIEYSGEPWSTSYQDLGRASEHVTLSWQLENEGDLARIKRGVCVWWGWSQGMLFSAEEATHQKTEWVKAWCMLGNKICSDCHSYVWGRAVKCWRSWEGSNHSGLWRFVTCGVLYLGVLSSIRDSKQNSMVSLHFDKLWLPAVYTVNLSTARWVAGSPGRRQLQRRNGELMYC